MTRTRQALFCQEHAADYRTFSPLYLVALGIVAVVAVLSYVLASWFGPIIVLGLFVVLRDNIDKLQSENTRRARNAIYIGTLSDNQIEYRFRNEEYAEAFRTLNE